MRDSQHIVLCSRVSVELGGALAVQARVIYRFFSLISNFLVCILFDRKFKFIIQISQAMENDEFQCAHDDVTRMLDNFVQKVVYVLVRNAVDYDLW